MLVFPSSLRNTKSERQLNFGVKPKLHVTLKKKFCSQSALCLCQLTERNNTRLRTASLGHAAALFGDQHPSVCRVFLPNTIHDIQAPEGKLHCWK